MDNRQVSWWDTHVFIAALVAQADNLPGAGTPAWCSLAEDDPRKLLAVAISGEHHVLRVETAQAAMADAGSRGDSYDNALAEAVNAAYKTELIYRCRPWRGVDDVELATAQWVAWYN